MPGLLNTLARLDEASGNRRGIPNWALTHPPAADRVAKVQETVARRAGRGECHQPAAVRAAPRRPRLRRQPREGHSCAAASSSIRSCGSRCVFRKAGRSPTPASRCWPGRPSQQRSRWCCSSPTSPGRSSRRRAGQHGRSRMEAGVGRPHADQRPRRLRRHLPGRDEQHAGRRAGGARARRARAPT